MRTIFVPPHAGVLSALGLAITAERRERMVSVLTLAHEMDAAALGREMERAATDVAAGTGWRREWVARARYVGQGHELDVPVRPGDDGDTLGARFTALHEQRNGFTLAAHVEVIGLRHLASGPPHPVRFARHAESAWSASSRVDDGGAFAARLEGPAVVVLPGATLRVAAGWLGEPHETGGWLLQRRDMP
jgi:N-methylhydantoinase A